MLDAPVSALTGSTATCLDLSADLVTGAVTSSRRAGGQQSVSCADEVPLFLWILLVGAALRQIVDNQQYSSPARPSSQCRAVGTRSRFACETRAWESQPTKERGYLSASTEALDTKRCQGSGLGLWLPFVRLCLRRRTEHREQRRDRNDRHHLSSRPSVVARRRTTARVRSRYYLLCAEIRSGIPGAPVSSSRASPCGGRDSPMRSMSQHDPLFGDCRLGPPDMYGSASSSAEIMSSVPPCAFGRSVKQKRALLAWADDYVVSRRHVELLYGPCGPPPPPCSIIG